MGKAFIQESTLTDIADAIRLRKGVNDTFLPSQMAAALKGATVALDVIEDGVNFYDYDGTLLYAYTQDEVLASGWKLPPLPDRTKENLINDGWNWTAEQIVSYVNSNHWYLAVGCTYHTNDNRTYIYLDVFETNTNRQLCIYTGSSSEIKVNWGDGTTADLLNQTSTVVTLTHDYVQDSGVKKEYVITIEANGMWRFGTSYMCGTENANSSSRIKKILLSNNFNSILSYCFASLTHLEKISLYISSSSSANNSTNVFQGCTSLRHITMPPCNHNFNQYAYDGCSSLQSVSIAYGNYQNMLRAYSGTKLKNISLIARSMANGYTFSESGLQRYRVLSSNATIGTQSFYNCAELFQLELNAATTTINASAIRNCTSLIELTIPENVASLGGYALAGNTSLKRLYMRPKTPPAIASTTLNNLPPDCKIYVWHDYLADYQQDASWSAFANQIYPYNYDLNMEV